MPELTSREILSGLIETLISYSFDWGGEISSNQIEIGDWGQFFDILLTSITSFAERGRYLPLDCFLELCIGIGSSKDAPFRDSAFRDMIGLLDYFSPNSKAIAQMFDWLRTSAKLWAPDDRSVGILNPELHRVLLDRMLSKLKDDNPDHILFNGQHDCFVEVSSIPWTFTTGFTLSYWIKIPAVITNKSFELIRCKSPLLSIEVLLVAKSESGLFSVRVVSSSEKRGRDEMRGDLLITSGEWHFLTIKYLGGTNAAANTISFSVDGSVLLESKLTYPVVSQSLETLWTFGNSFQGLIGSITLYSGEVNQNYLHFLHSLGPYISDVGKGASTPQSSYDSGHTPLGTLFTKGPWTKVHKLPRVFCLNPLTVKSNFTLSLSKAGRQFQEFVSLSTSQKQEMEQSLMVGLHGKCTTVQGLSWVDQVFTCGGVTLPLYLFWTYCTKLGRVGLTDDVHLKACLQKLLGMIQHLVATHIDMKEQFIQLHGYHVLAHSLYRCFVDAKDANALVDASLIGGVVDVVVSFGLDSTKGDGVAAALQGLLFDFRLWSLTALPHLKMVLEAAGTVAHSAVDQMYTAIGIQRLLDLVRIHLLKPLTITSRTPEDQKTIAIDCADELLRMLIIMKDSAHAHAQKQKTNISADIDSLLGCLEETNNNLLAERILRLLIQTRHTSPGSLKRSMMNYRFLDTTILAVWMKKGMSLEVRSHAFKLLLWMLSVELHALPSKLYEMRRNVRFVSFVQSSSQSRKLKPVQADLNRIRLGLSQLKEESKGLSKIWRNLWMLAEVVERGLADEIWGASYPVVLPPSTVGGDAAASASSSSCSNSESSTNGASPDLQFLITDMSMEFQRTAWLYLPFLVPMLSRATVDVAVKTMMLVNVQFKTDEHVLEALMASEQELWVTMFLKLTWMGTKRFYTTTGDVAMELETLADISAETFSIVVEYLMRMGIDDDAAFWPSVVDLAMDFTKTVAVTSAGSGGGGSPVVPSSVVPTSSFGFLFLRRVVYLVLQRIVKTSEDAWSPTLVQSVNVLLDVITKHSLHKVPANVATSVASSASSSLLDLDEQRHLEWTHAQWSARESEQLVYFLLDLLNALLRVSKKVSWQGGIEWLAMIRVYHLMLDCTADAVSDAVLERLLTEMYQFLGKASETAAPYTESEFYALVVKTFTTMKDNIFRLDYLHPKRAKYEANVFRLLGHFTDLRLRVQEGYDVPVHVRKTMEALRIVGQMADIKMIFDVLEQTFKVNQPSIISFDDFVATDDLLHPSAEAAAGASTAAAAPAEFGRSAAMDTAAQTLLDLTEAGDGMIPPPDAGVAAFAAAAAGGGASDVTGGGSSPSVASLPPVADVAPVTVAARYARAFPQWLALRQSIISERIDTERARLTRAMTLQDIATESTKKFWRRLRRKVEAEVFQEAHYCQWKLGIAHEGPFFGRKRLICRPKYDNFYGGLVPSPLHQQQRHDASFVHDVDLSSDELNEALQRQYTGYIKDVTRSEGGEGGGGAGTGSGSGTGADGTIGDDSRHGDAGAGASASASTTTGAGAGDGSVKRDDENGGGGYVDLPGGGWGVVGADGSEEGFGVVGVAQDFSPVVDASDLTGGDTPVVPTSKASGNAASTTTATAAASAAAAVDEDGRPLRPTTNVVGDADELYRAGRTAIETGPCQAAMFKLEHAFKLEAKVVMLTASGTCWGVFAIHGDELTFRSSSEQSEARKQDHASVNAAKDTKLRRRRWKIEHIAYIYLRRYRQRDSALEIFFRKGKHRSVFVDFGHTREDAKLRNEFAKAVSQAAPSSAFKQTPSMSAFRMVYEHDNIQEKWLQGKISNFDYLMALNTIAGRSFNDLCQYPVMPWVLNDYTSPTINLHDASVYRDLSKPMGALNPTRLKEFLDRFHSFEENVSSGIPAFMYGSHYSTMVGVVLHFLVRLQPFAALHQEMQNGHFDVPDRLFSSIPRSFAHNTNQLSEVKELIPEFFTNPDIFRNVNNFNFGETQDGDNIDNVELPPWAKTPEDFVRIHRDALESDYVSEHLHEWIDLIFGYKQRGPDAIEACNVFYYLTYYGSVDHYLITDEAIRKATELQIAHFGQIPMQLFKTPHPARRMHKIRSAPTFVRPLKDCFSAASFSSSSSSSSSSPSVMRLIEPRSDEESIATEAPATLLVRNANSVVIALLVHLDRVTLVLDTGVLDTVKYAASDEVKAMLQAAKEAAKDDTAVVTSTTSTAALAAAPTLATGGSGGGGGGGSSASGSSRMGRRVTGEAGASSTVAVAAPATVNFPEDFLFPPSSSGRSTSGDGSTSSGSAAASATTAATTAVTAAAAASSRRGRGYSATEDLLGLDSGGQSLDSSTSSATSASLTTFASGGSHASAWTRPFVTLRDGESIFTIEREVHHFETLPRLPISKKLVQLRWQQRAAAASSSSSSSSLAPSAAAARSSASTASTVAVVGGAAVATDRYEQYYKVKPPVQASESIAEAMASLVVFSRNRLLALTIGDVDGTVHVRELDHKLGAVKSAADFCVHRSRVISASIDQNGREYHLVATLDEQGTVLVWTIYAPKSGAQSSGGSSGPNGGAAGANGGGTGSGSGSGSGAASGTSSASASGKDAASSGGSGAMGTAGTGAATGGGVGVGGSGAGGAASGAGSGAGAAGATAAASATTEQEYLARLHSYTIGRRPQRRFYVAPTADMRVDVSWAMGLVTVVTGTRVHLFSIERDELLRVFDVPVTMDNGLDVLSSSSVVAAGARAPTSQPTAATSESGDLLLDVTDVVVTSDDDSDEANVDVNGGAATLAAGHHRECATSGPVACVFARDRFVRPAAAAAAAAVSAPPSRHFLRRLVVSDYGVVVTHVESVTTVESLLEYEDAVVHVHRLVAQTMSGTVTGVVQALSPITCLVCPDRAEVVLVGHRDGSVVVYRVQNMQVLYRWQPDAHCVAVPLVSSSLAHAMAASISSAAGAATSSMRGGRGSLASASSQPPVAVSQPPLSPAQAVDTSAIVTIAVGPSAAAPAVLLLSTEAGNLYIRALPDFVRWEKNRNPTVLQMASEQLQAVKGTILQAQNWGAETAGVIAQNAMAELKKMRNNSIVKGVFGFFGAQLGGGNTDNANDASNNNTNGGNSNNNNNNNKTAKKK